MYAFTPYERRGEELYCPVVHRRPAQDEGMQVLHILQFRYPFASDLLTILDSIRRLRSENKPAG